MQRLHSFTIGIQRDNIRRVQNLHRQPLLRGVVVTFHTDPTIRRVFECFLQSHHVEAQHVYPKYAHVIKINN